MALYDITATGYYQCKDERGRFLPRDPFTKTYQLELSSPDDSYIDEIFALLESDAPPGCVQIGGISTNISPSAYGPGADAGLGEAPPDDRPVGRPGEMVTIYATVACEDQNDGGIYYRTIRTDVPWDATVDSVIQALFETADGLDVCSSGGNNGSMLGITITAPAYFQYLTVV